MSRETRGWLRAGILPVSGFLLGSLGACSSAPDSNHSVDLGNPTDLTDLAVTLTDGAMPIAADLSMPLDGAPPPCGARVQPYLFKRLYGDSAAWNTPVCNLPADPRSDEWRDRFWYFSRENSSQPPESDPNLGNHGIMFGLDADPDLDFSVVVTDAANATTMRRVRQKMGWNGSLNVKPDETVPWNPSWRASYGSDGLLVILDHSTGREWDVWAVAQPDPRTGLINDSQCWGWKLTPEGYDATTDLCVGGLLEPVTPAGAPIDFRTWSGNQPYARGGGIMEPAMLTLPEEVAAGEIRHALMMPVFNTMYGRDCTDAERATDAFGSICGAALAPAGNFERVNGTQYGCKAADGMGLDDVTLRKRTIPEGLRLALTVSDADIDQWLDDRQYIGTKRSTARVFAVALRDYGWMITDTSCFAAEFQVAGGANPTTAAAWRALGIDGDGRDLLYGLFTRDRIWAVQPPLQACSDGTKSRFQCRAVDTAY